MILKCFSFCVQMLLLSLQLINQTVLSNRRAYGDLFVRLMSTDIEREKSQHMAWKRRVNDWKMLKTELAVKRFKWVLGYNSMFYLQNVTFLDHLNTKFSWWTNVSSLCLASIVVRWAPSVIHQHFNNIFSLWKLLMDFDQTANAWSNCF